MAESIRKDEIKEDILLNLGALMVGVELEEKHCDAAIRFALDRYRQRSGLAYEETFIFLDVEPEKQEYTLPQEVQHVRSVLRRTVGGTSGGGSSVDPFGLAWTNNLYLLQNPSALGGGGAGTLATYDFAMQYQELIGRMFGRDVQFTFNEVSKKLVLHRKFGGSEQVALDVFRLVPEDILLENLNARTWIRDYATARAKMMLGQARSKFSTLAGPQGGVSFNGDALKSEAATEMERLDTELKDGSDNGGGMGFVIG